MKLMNKYIIAFFTLALVAVSCESDFEPPHETTNRGGFIRFEEVKSGSINPADPDSRFEADLVAPGGNVRLYDVDFTLHSGTLGDLGPFDLLEISSFPATMTITADEIAAAAGLNVNQLNAGDRIAINAAVTNENGTTFTAADFTGDLLNPGQRQALQFNIFLLCPWNQSEAVGMYRIVTDDFQTTLDPDRPVEVVAGPGENEVTFKNLFSHPEMYDVTVTVPTPDNAQAVVDKQPAWHCDNFGCAFGEGRVEGGGFFFSCSGFVTLDLTHTVDAGSFGTFKLELEKIQ